MRKAKTDEVRPEYKREDLTDGVRGKYYRAFRRGSNLALLSPEVAKAFPTDEAVNNALRSLMEIAQRSVKNRKSS